MKTTLNYTFERRTNNHFEWLLTVIKSEKYFEADSLIMTSPTMLKTNYAEAS